MGEDVHAGLCQQTATHLARRSDRSVCMVARRGGPMAGPPSPSPSTLFSPSITRRGLPCESELWSPLPLVSCFSSSESPLPSSRRIVARFPTRGRPSPVSPAGGVADMTSGAATDDRGSKAGRGEMSRGRQKWARRGARGRWCGEKGRPDGGAVHGYSNRRYERYLPLVRAVLQYSYAAHPVHSKRVSPFNHTNAGSRQKHEAIILHVIEACRVVGSC